MQGAQSPYPSQDFYCPPQKWNGIFAPGSNSPQGRKLVQDRSPHVRKTPLVCHQKGMSDSLFVLRSITEGLAASSPASGTGRLSQLPWIRPGIRAGHPPGSSAGARWWKVVANLWDTELGSMTGTATPAAPVFACQLAPAAASVGRDCVLTAPCVMLLNLHQQQSQDRQGMLVFLRHTYTFGSQQCLQWSDSLLSGSAGRTNNIYNFLVFLFL